MSYFLDLEGTTTGECSYVERFIITLIGADAFIFTYVSFVNDNARETVDVHWQELLYQTFAEAVTKTLGQYTCFFDFCENFDSIEFRTFSIAWNYWSLISNKRREN